MRTCAARWRWKRWSNRTRARCGRWWSGGWNWNRRARARTVSEGNDMKSLMGATQNLGRALMLPIAVLPMAAAGDAIFSNLGLLFAIGVAVGLARENHGAAGLAAVVGFLVATKGAEVLINAPADVIARGDLAIAAHKARELAKLSVPLGI